MTLAVALTVGPISVATASAATDRIIAQANQTGTVHGTVSENSGAPIAGATVTASGPVVKSTLTGGDGGYTLVLPPGVYNLTATKTGYEGATQTDYVVLAGASGLLNVSLVANTLTSIREIGRITVSRGRSSFNASPASVAVISNQAFADQGQLQVQRILDQTPGIVIDHPGTSATNASPGAITFPSIRGGLGFETASLIDGHPLAVQTFGDYVTTFLNADVIQSTELIKGPGAAAPEVNFAINGTVNFRTLDPTSKPSGQLKYGIDSFGGQNSNFRFSDTFNKKFGMVLDFAVNGSPGPLRDVNNTVTLGSGVQFNCPVLGGPTCQAQAGFTTNPVANPNAQNNPNISTTTAVACCVAVSQTYNNRTELAKFRYSFSDATVATVSYLGSQTWTEQNGNHVYKFGSLFTPGAGYTAGVYATGTPVFSWQNVFFPAGEWEVNNEPIFQGEIRSSIGKDTILARYYAASINRLQYNALHAGTDPFTPTMTINGTVVLCPPTFVAGSGANSGKCAPTSAGPFVAPPPTAFNNVPVVLNMPGTYFESSEEDKLHGATFEYDHYLGDSGNVISLSFDQVSGTSTSYSFSGTGLQSNSIQAGSSVRYTTVLLRGIFNLTPKLNATISNYFDSYAQRYTSDDAVTWQTANSNRYDGRVGLAWRPDPNISFRLSAGSAVAPPYLALLDSRAGQPTMNNSLTFATQTINNGKIVPETSFGYNFGFDARLGGDGSTVLSFDAYRNNLFNQFITSATYQNGTATVCNSNGGTPITNPCGAGFVTVPLFVTGSENLTNSRYEGVELAIRRDPRVGLGFAVQGALIHAYPYNINPCLYTSTIVAGSPVCTGTPTTNLGIVPGVNFYGSGTSGTGSFNAVNNHAIPYSQGYGEIHFRTERGGYLSFGEQYYGNNNSLNVPAFFVANATARIPLGNNGLSFQASADNLFGAYPNPWITEFAGTAVPLVNGKLGLTNQNVIGPRNLRLSLTQKFGQ